MQQGGGAACARAGCVHQHRKGPQWHRYCCNACRRGESTHTQNCSGARTPVKQNPAAECARPGCPHRHLGGQRNHGFCCNACRLQEAEHTKNCSGRGQPVGASTEVKQPQANAQLIGRRGPKASAKRCAFKVPDEWLLRGGCLAEHIAWYQQRYGVTIDEQTRDTWAALENAVPRRWNPKGRHLVLYAYAKGYCPDRLHCVDVHESGLNAHCNRYRMDSVTGVDFEVQATLLAQEETAHVLYEACACIETEDLDEFGFVCSHATHRSVACCVLLATLFYHGAVIVLTTPRTCDQARMRNMIPLEGW